MDANNLTSVLNHFDFSGDFLQCIPYGSGHINDTYCISFAKKDQSVQRYILQRMNDKVFQKPLEVMENIAGVTEWLKKEIMKEGGDIHRETLNVILTHEGKNCYVDPQGKYWRVYDFIEGARTFDMVEEPRDFYESAKSFGHFQRLLADYPASTLHETIPNFHNTVVRFQQLQLAVENDSFGRVKDAKQEIDFFYQHQPLSTIFDDLRKKGEIPLRVTHNDTKLNNIMIDDKTHKGICVIDLDTVMPGLAVNDFGDSIRFGASTAAEDEKDLTKVSCSLELFELYTKGFIEGCEGSLTEKEMSMLAMGAQVMTYECGMRFLTDFLQGDTYFKTHYPNQNLDRTRTQMTLVSDMGKKMTKMNQIVQKYSGGKDETNTAV